MATLAARRAASAYRAALRSAPPTMMPPMLIRPVLTEDAKVKDKYMCPVYKTRERGQGNESIRYQCTGPLMLEKQSRIF